MSLIRAIKGLVELSAVRYVLPMSKPASEAYAKAWKQFVFQYQPRHSCCVAEMIDKHAVVWAEQGRTGAIRRAKRDAYEARMMASVKAMRESVAALSLPVCKRCHQVIQPGDESEWAPKTLCGRCENAGVLAYFKARNQPSNDVGKVAL